MANEYSIFPPQQRIQIENLVNQNFPGSDRQAYIQLQKMQAYYEARSADTAWSPKDRRELRTTIAGLSIVGVGIAVFAAKQLEAAYGLISGGLIVVAAGSSKPRELRRSVETLDAERQASFIQDALQNHSGRPQEAA